MKKNLLFIAIFLMSYTVLAQNDYQVFYAESMKTNTAGMYVLGSWALANIATGAVGWSRNTGQPMYFHQMNLFWNTVNLGIAGFALYSNLTTDVASLATGELYDKHLQTERLYLINGGLDIAYMGAGLLLRHLSTRDVKRPEMLRGYGNSVILQGGFLFVFDGIMYLIQRSHRLEFLDSIQIGSVPGGMELGMRLMF
jgi:hypothetical protein